LLKLTDLVNYKIAANGRLSDGEILKDLIKDDRISEEKREMADGAHYFGVKNDILKQDFRKYTTTKKSPDSLNEYEEEYTDKNKANNRLAHGFHRRLVLEKVSYLLKEMPTFSHTDKALIQRIMDFVGKDFHETLITWAENASNKGREWLHVFWDGAVFDYMVMDAQEIIPVYETSRQKKLVQLIRYYPVRVKTGQSEVLVTGGQVYKHREPVKKIKEDVRYYAEWWHPDRVEKWEEGEAGEFNMVSSEPHFSLEGSQGDNLPGSWGEVPFIELKNNVQCWSDLRFIKSLIDDYDRSASVLSNNFEDLQEVFVFGSGMTDSGAELRHNLRKHKAGTSGDAEAKIQFFSVEIPHQGRMEQLKNLEENIFANGMGINPKSDKLGNDPSGVALRWMYVPLDLKAGLLERRIDNAIRKFFELVSKAMVINGDDGFNADEIEIELNKFMIANESKQIDDVEKSKSISRKTKLKHHPWVDNPEEEIKEIEKDDVGGEDIGKIPLAIQQLALAKQRAIDTGNIDEATKIATTIDSLLSKISKNGATNEK
jgi:SPP1 family phage portal protein